MKAVIASILLLAAAILCSAVNAVFVNAEAYEMTQITENILEGGESRLAELERLESRWAKDQPIFRLSAGLREVDRVSETLIVLQNACESGNEWAIRQGCALFCDALDDIARYETFNIFKAL